MRKYLKHIWLGQRRKTLRDFIRLVLAFFACLVVLSAYQFVRLYLDGVLPSIWNSSFFTQVLHHSGFTALISFILAFVFQVLERHRKLLGFGFTAGIFLVLLILEGLLIEYYVRYYEILGADFIQKFAAYTSYGKLLLSLLLLLPITAGMLLLFYKINSSSYRILNKMYPFTIILFTWFLATLVSEKNPINQNKTQYLAESFAKKYMGTKSYENGIEYPLLRPYKSETFLADRFEFKEDKPNVVLIIVDGLESKYLQTDGPLRAIMPYLNALSEQSLRWDNHVSNSNGNSSLSVILGSLPLAENSIRESETYVNRNTLVSILAHNGYHTAFYSGGNSALGGVDKFLTQEQVNELVDNKQFGPAYTAQDKDAAGISLGYPDKELYRYWNDRYAALSKPKLEVFFTLSTRKPYLIPDRRSYRSRVNRILDEANLDWGARRGYRDDRDMLASMAYADDALKDLLEQYYRQKPEYRNTIFVITGNSEREDIEDDLVESLHAPLMIFSPMLKEPETFTHLVSHADITPGLLSLVDAGFKLKMPTHVAWTGTSLSPDRQAAGKVIPVYDDQGGIHAVIRDHYLLAGRELYTQGKGTTWHVEDNPGMKHNLTRMRSDIHMRNAYMIAENKILPDEQTLIKLEIPAFTKREIAWINSVFNGRDYDAAYEKARDLALTNDSDRALLLSKYILVNVPGHVDTEILMARIYGWQQQFDRASAILERTIEKYPSYASGYEALLDVYYWSNNNHKAMEIASLAKENNIQDQTVMDRITRAKNIINNNRKEQAVNVLPEKVRR